LEYYLKGYIYPKEERAVRDLLRKRLLLVRQKTAHILSFKNLVSRNLGRQMKRDEVIKLGEEDAEKIFSNEHIVLSGKANIAAIQFLLIRIEKIEKAVLEVVKLKGNYKKLMTVPGIGKILALTIMFETGDIKRFPKVGNYVSYCRLVGSRRVSNGKQKGEGNRKNGNKYLSWAYVEAANFALWHYPYIKKYYQKKTSKTNKIVAIKAVAHKLARASYYVMKDEVVFDPKRAFS